MEGLKHYMTIGSGRMHWIVWLPMYFVPLLWIRGTESAMLEFFYANACAQLALFVCVCQIPALVTGRMAYVDIAWPWGLVVLASNLFAYSSSTSEGSFMRKTIMCVCLGLHGLRMGLGALSLFGKMTKWTYRFENDLPRYRYARVRWETQCGMSARGWWLKVQHDTLQQCFANVAILSAPIALACFSEHPNIRPLEIAGVSVWALAWIFENMADVQKLNFVRKIKSDLRACDKQDLKRRTELKTACLGIAPYAGGEYWLWSKCRHPNYFFEWLAWIGLCVAAIPALLEIRNLFVRAGFAFVLFAVVRFFYDCLCHWTGAGPAEHYSVLKRPKYRTYQETVRCFFPFEVPLVNHHRRAKWSSL